MYIAYGTALVYILAMRINELLKARRVDNEKYHGISASDEQLYQPGDCNNESLGDYLLSGCQVIQIPKVKRDYDEKSQSK